MVESLEYDIIALETYFLFLFYSNLELSSSIHTFIYSIYNSRNFRPHGVKHRR